MKPEERANVMKTLKELTEKISQLQNEMAPTSQGPKTNHSQAKTKTDVGPGHRLLLCQWHTGTHCSSSSCRPIRSCWMLSWTSTRR